jgi:hypothetical protein
MPKLLKPAKRWVAGTRTKQKQVPAILGVKPYPAPKVILTPPRQYTRHSKSSTSNRPIPLNEGIRFAPPHFEQVVAKFWMPCSDGVAFSDTLPRQSRAQHSAFIAKVPEHHTSSLLISLGAMSSSPLPQKSLVLAISLCPPRVGHVAFHGVQL